MRCKYWNDMGHPDYKVNVNLSVVQLLQNDIVEQIAEVISETGIDPKNLTLEVTESLAINDMNRMKKILADIKKLGVRVALDDFGTGYSSLGMLSQSPADIVKIDRLFITAIGDEENEFNRSFIGSVIQLCHRVGISVCVEGVERKNELDTVCSLEADCIQGYYISKPLLQEDFEKKFWDV